MSFQSGKLLNATPFPVLMAVSNASWPATVSLVSSAPGRLIELSADGGTTWFSPSIDATTANGISVGVFAPVSHARFTGATNDAWSIRG